MIVRRFTVEGGFPAGEPRGGRTLRWPGVFTVPMTVGVARRLPSFAPLHELTGGSVLRPANASTPELRDLAEYLAPRILALSGGDEHLKRSPLLAPIAAMVASVRLVMSATSRTTRTKKVLYRNDVLNDCLDTLELATHRRTAERIIRRDDPSHLHVQASTDGSCIADGCITPLSLRNGFGLFARTADGDLIAVTSTNRRSFQPRILFSLAEEEPL